MVDAPSPPLIARASEHRGRTAIVDSRETYTYDQLLEASARVASALLAGRDDLARRARRVPDHAAV